MAKTPDPVAAPAKPSYMTVRVGSTFEAHNVSWRPGVEYTVTNAVYNDIKDKCVSAEVAP